MLNLYHILIDGLFDSVPVVLAFMALALGSGETDVGLVVSLGAALSTAVGLGTGQKVYMSGVNNIKTAVGKHNALARSPQGGKGGKQGRQFQYVGVGQGL